MTLKSNIPRLRRALPDALDTATAQAAGRVKDVRDDLVPVDTSALLRSGRVIRHDAARYEVREGEGLPDARAAYTEYGTSRMAAQPHMTPAAAEGARFYPERAKAEVRAAIKGATL